MAAAVELIVHLATDLVAATERQGRLTLVTL